MTGRIKKMPKMTLLLLLLIASHFLLLSDGAIKWETDWQNTLKMIDRIIELDKENTQKQASSALYQIGYIYYKWKKYQKAVEAMLSIHTVYPGSEEAVDGYAAAAYYAEKIKDNEGALQILRNFIKAYPNSEYAERSRKRIKKLEESVKK